MIEINEKNHVAQLYCWDLSFPPTLTLLKEAAGVAWKLKKNFCHSTVLNSEAPEQLFATAFSFAKVFPLETDIVSKSSDIFPKPPDMWQFSRKPNAGRLSRCATERCLLLCWADSKAAYKARFRGVKSVGSELPEIRPYWGIIHQGGGFKHFYFLRLFWRSYFSDGLKPKENRQTSEFIKPVCILGMFSAQRF